MKVARDLTRRITHRQRALTVLRRFERTRFQVAHPATEVRRFLSRLLERLSRRKP